MHRSNNIGTSSDTSTVVVASSIVLSSSSTSSSSSSSTSTCSSSECTAPVPMPSLSSAADASSILERNVQTMPSEGKSMEHRISSSRFPTARSHCHHHPTLLLLLLSTFLVCAFFMPTHSNAFPSPFSKAMISHSGPTNALWGHEQLVPEEEVQERQKRQVYYGNTGTWMSPAVTSAAGPDGYQQMWITSEHNRYRRMVPATNMRMVYWSEELARSAQAHANTCDFRHSRNRVNIGENIWAAPYYNYSDAIQIWYNEVNNPWCGCSTGYKYCCGHFIQLVWAQTSLIGCGYAQCNGVIGVGGYGRAVFVCHYNPQGNKFPAFNWARTESERCSQCPQDQPACHQGLCYMPLNYQQQQPQQANTTAVAPAAVATTTIYGGNNNYYNNNYNLQQQQQQQQQAALDRELENNKVDIRRRMRR